MVNFVVTVIIASMLAAAFVTLPVLFTNALDGWRGTAVGFAAAWVSGAMVATLAYLRFRDALKRAFSRLIFDS